MMKTRLFLLVGVAALSVLQGFAQAPKVTTDPRFVRGATMAFGRIKSASANGGAAISKRGFCYAETPNPTIEDNVNAAELTNNGIIYWMKDLKPATKYYMRAYATNKNGETGYGEVIKFYTTPMGNVTFTYNNSGSAEQNQRIKDALTNACWYFNNLIYTTRRFNVGYSAGTQTADCNYQPEPWMNVGPNASYQRTGTIMHEMEHGLGLQNYSTQWSKGNLRTGVNSGNWTGDRANAAVRFWDNDNTAVLKGDGIHMWPYGINGAHEDTGTDVLYLGNAIICQGLGEDGLEHNETRHADPYYSLNQEDTIKFYLKNESADRGLYTSYLIPNASGVLKWRELTTEQIAKNDSAAWYITFTPNNQYYQFRNAATGQYLTYSSAIKTASKTSLTANENWHLMRGRVDVDGQRGYWIIHPESNWTPKCLQANANGNTSAVNFNIANAAEVQRWLIMTLDEAIAQETKTVSSMKKEAESALNQTKVLTDIPHTEDVAGADQTFANTLSDLSTRLTAATNTSELSAIIAEANQATSTFLQSVSVIDPAKPFDLTYMLINPTLDTNTDGWSVAASVSYGCAEFYEKTFDFNQILKQMPAGTYQFCAQGFQRPGSTATSYSDFAAGTNKVNAVIYAGSKNSKISHICDTMPTRKIGKGTEVAATTGRYVPNDMQAASAYFQKGLYDNSVFGTVASNGASLKVGIKSTSMPTSYWCIFDNFRLWFYGKMSAETVTAIQTVTTSVGRHHDAVYTLDGRRLSPGASLRPGLYIVNGRKVLVR